MNFPYPWRTFLIISAIATLVASIFAWLNGYNASSYHPNGAGFTWQDLTPDQRLASGFQYVIITAPLSFAGALLALILLRFIWYFLLARLGELSKAIRST